MAFADNKINDFYGDINSNYQDFILYNKNFFEDYCSKVMKTGVLIKDFISNDHLFDEIYKALLIDFDSFVIFCNITNYKKEQINIWKNFLLTIRLLCKYKVINQIHFFYRRFQIIYENITNLNLKYFIFSKIIKIVFKFNYK